MRTSLHWYLPDHRWWLRLVMIPLIVAALVGSVWWCVVAAQTWRWPAALAHLNVQVLLVAALWLVSALPNECLLLTQAWRRQRRRAAAMRGQHDALPLAAMTMLAVDNRALPVTWKGVFPKPDFSLAALTWQILSLLGAIGLVTLSGGLLVITLLLAITGQLASYAAYLQENGVAITPTQIAIGTAILFLDACAWLWQARQPDRAISFMLTVAPEGVMWQLEGQSAITIQWGDIRSLEVAPPPHDPALPTPRATVNVLRGRHATIWWYSTDSLSAAMALIARHSGLPITTLEPTLSSALPRAWHILSRNNSFQVMAGYLILMAAAIALVPPTPLGWLNTVFGEIVLGGAVVQLAAFIGLSAQTTSRYRRAQRHPLHVTLPPPPPRNAGATYVITYQVNWLGRLLTFLAGLPLALGLPLFVLWEIQAANGMAGGVQVVNVLLGIATIPLSILGVISMLRAMIVQSRRYAVEVAPDTITLRYLGRIGKRESVLIAKLAWAETERLLIRVREGRVEGYRILHDKGRQSIPWPALPGRSVRRGDGGPAITAAALTALVVARSGQSPEIWDQTGEPYAPTQQALRDAAILNGFGA